MSMTSQEVKQLCGGFLAQVRGLFAGIEKLPLAFEEVERREKACDAREDHLRNLDQAYAHKEQCCADLDAAHARKQGELDGVVDTVGKNMAEEEQRQRATLEGRLAPLRAEIETVNQELREKKALLATLKV
jgi:chromosome segregation ATPase